MIDGFVRYIKTKIRCKTFLNNTPYNTIGDFHQVAAIPISQSLGNSYGAQTSCLAKQVPGG